MTTRSGRHLVPRRTITPNFLRQRSVRAKFKVFEIMADNGKICIHLVFSRGNSASIQNKVHEFWSFLDAENYLLPVYSQRYSTATLKSESPILEEEKDKVQNRIWHKEFKNFRRLGLDRAALATATKCKTCHVDTRCSDYADTVDPSYEELSEEMEAFDRRTSNL